MLPSNNIATKIFFLPGNIDQILRTEGVRTTSVSKRTVFREKIQQNAYLQQPPLEPKGFHQKQHLEGS